MRKGKDPDPKPDPYLWLVYLDPGGPKACIDLDPDPPKHWIQLTYGPGKLSEYVGLKNEPGELLEPAHLVGDGLQVVLLQVQDTQPTHNTSNIGSNALPPKKKFTALPPKVCTIDFTDTEPPIRHSDRRKDELQIFYHKLTRVHLFLLVFLSRYYHRRNI